jgi:exopolysaccharide production protein ExoZ
MAITKSLDTLQAGRAAAAIAVVLFHVNITLARSKYLGRDIFHVFNAGYSGVHYFFVLSGFVIFMAHAKEIGHPDKIAEFLWKRFRRIYPPLWILLILLVPVFFFVPAFASGAETSPWSVTSAFIIFPFEGDIYHQVLSVEWTLRHEILFYLLFAITIWRARIGLMLSMVWLMSCAVVSVFASGSRLSPYFSSYDILFGFGIIASFVFLKGYVKWPAATLILGVFLFFVVWSQSEVSRDDCLTNWAFGSGATLIILGAAELERTRGLHLPRLLTFVGEASYAIYLVHFPVISIVCKFIVKLDGRLPDRLLFLATAVIAICAGVIFHIAIEKRALEWMPRSPPLHAELARVTQYCSSVPKGD